jgi:hypothetical protein
MQEFDFALKYVQGKANGAADALSRKEAKQIQSTWNLCEWTNGKPVYHY